MTTHHLKINKQPFDDLVSGRKTGEVRNCADRQFEVGDAVELFLMDETGNPANQSIVRVITHIQRGYGLPDDICVLSYAAPVVERQPTPWSYCPECGSQKLHHEEGEHKQCANCYHEWFSDIDYSQVVRGNLEKLKSSPPAPVAVVLPDRKPWATSKDELDIYTRMLEQIERNGWNACLDKLKELNQ